MLSYVEGSSAVEWAGKHRFPETKLSRRLSPISCSQRNTPLEHFDGNTE